MGETSSLDSLTPAYDLRLVGWWPLAMIIWSDEPYRLGIRCPPIPQMPFADFRIDVALQRPDVNRVPDVLCVVLIISFNGLMVH